MNVSTQEILLKNTSVKLFIRREDLIHPFVSGNKFRKLKYNLLEAKNQKKTMLIIGSKEKINLKDLEKFGNVKELTLEEIFGY